MLVHGWHSLAGWDWVNVTGFAALGPIGLLWTLQLGSGQVSGAREGGRAVLLWSGPNPLPRGDAVLFTDEGGILVECKGGGWPLRIGLMSFFVVSMSATIAIADGIAPPQDVHAAILAIAVVMALTVAFRVSAFPHRVDVPYGSLIEARRDGRRLHFVVRTDDDGAPAVLDFQTSAEHAQATIEALHERGVDVTPGRVAGGAER